MNTSPNQSTLTGHIRDAADSLADFLVSKDDRVFVLKGPYGAGKSFFLRWFLASDKGNTSADQFTFMSYASVFGVNDLKELQNVMLGSITLRKLGDSSSLKMGVLDRALAIIQKGASPFFAGVNLELSAGSIIWSIAKTKGVLLIVDDVDRKGTNLQLDSIVGFANSLTEQTDGKTKVIFVLNEEQLTNDDSALWSKLREKFIDIEFRFHPSSTEIAGLFIKDDSVRDLIGSIHTRLNKPNIRSMRKIQLMAKRLNDYLKDKQVSLDPSEVAHAIRCAALYLHSGILLMGEELSRIHAKNWYFRDNDPPTDLEKSIYTIMKSIDFAPYLNLDLICITFFRDGAVAPELISTFETERMEELTREKFEKDRTAVWDYYNSNFLDTKDEFLKKSKHFLLTYREMIGYEELATILGVWEALDVDIQEEWRLWLQLRLNSLTPESIQRLRVIMPSNLHPLLDARVNEFVETIDPTVVFRDLYKSDNYGSQETIAKLAKWTEEDFLRWFSESDDPNLIVQLRKFLSVNYSPGDLQKVSETLLSALSKQASSSPFNELRVKRIFGSLIANNK